MWWERFGVAPVRPEDANRGWHKAELVLRQLTQLEKVVRAAGAARSIGWWLGPWQPAPKGHEAVITFYFEKRTEKDGFLDRPPAPAFRQEQERSPAADRARPATAKPAPVKSVASKPAVAKSTARPTKSKASAKAPTKSPARSVTKPAATAKRKPAPRPVAATKKATKGKGSVRKAP